MDNLVTLALPSKGAIAEPTITFLRESGLRIHKPNPRQYIGTMPLLPEIQILFQRVKDVAYKVADGTAHIGITGLDVVYEHPDPNTIIIHENLGYGHCKLLVAVPETWIDVESIQDIVDIALDFREYKQRNIRIATTYTNLAREYLHKCGIHHFTLVKADGAIEAAPTLGYADAVIDLTQTGTTLRENNLKPIDDSVIVSSQACLIGNKLALEQNPNILDTVRLLLEYVDASVAGKQYLQVMANIKGNNEEDVAKKAMLNATTYGLQGPTVAPIFGTSSDEEANSWFTITIFIQSKNLMTAVDHLRSIGGKQIVAVPAHYVFHETSPTYTRLLEQLSIQNSS